MANIDTNEDTKAKREQKTKSFWFRETDGTDGVSINGRNFVKTDDETLADALSLEVLGVGTIEAIFDEYPVEIQKAHRAFGVKQGFTNIPKTSPEETFEKIMARHESHMNGEWAQEAGPRVSLLVQASARVLNLSEQDQADLRKTLLAADIKKRESIAAKPQIAAAIAAIRAEAAAARSEAATKKAAGAETLGSMDDLLA